MPTQTPILEPGVAADYSDPVALEDGETVKVGIYSATPATLSAGDEFEIVETTPGADNHVGMLSNTCRSTNISGPGTYKVGRPLLTGSAFGVYKVE